MLAASAVLATIAYFAIQQFDARYSKDEETGEPCPGLSLTYECEIVEGGYLEFRIGMTSEAVFRTICRGSSVPRFRYAGIDAQGVPEELWRRRPGAFYVPTQSFSPSADEPQEFCELSEIAPYAVGYFVRRDRIWPFGDLLNLKIEDGRLHAIHIVTGTIDL
jgi:hypothetical protein